MQAPSCRWRGSWDGPGNPWPLPWTVWQNTGSPRPEGYFWAPSLAFLTFPSLFSMPTRPCHLFLPKPAVACLLSVFPQDECSWFYGRRIIFSWYLNKYYFFEELCNLFTKRKRLNKIQSFNGSCCIGCFVR
jgi:hypothetical protein